MDRGPNVNVDRFEHRPDGAVTALLTDGAAVELALDALRGLGVELSMVDILYGAEGVRIFDRTGREHGVKTRVVRWFQSLGYDENILAVYDEALRNGETLLTVPCARAVRYLIGRELVSLGAHGVIYASGISVETLTGP